MDLKTQITAFFNDVKEVLQVIAPICAFVGLIGAGIIYAGSAWPIIGKMKRDNPDLMNNILIGMIVMIAAGTLTSLIVFT